MLRNKANQGQTIPSTSEISEPVNRLSIEHTIAWQQKPKIPHLANWSAPPSGFLKVNYEFTMRLSEKTSPLLQACAATIEDKFLSHWQKASKHLPLPMVKQKQLCWLSNKL